MRSADIAMMRIMETTADDRHRLGDPRRRKFMRIHIPLQHCRCIVQVNGLEETIAGFERLRQALNPEQKP